MLKILVAEDEALSRMTLIHYLRARLGEDALIEGAANGREAVEQAERLHPQLIFMDIEMPVRSGIEAAESILSRQPAARIIFLTAFERFDYAVGAMRAGGADYLLKPFQKHEIDACLQKNLGVSLSDAPAPPPDAGGSPSSFQSQCDTWLAHHYTEDVSLKQAAAHMGMSTFYFSRLFRATYNRTFLEYLTAYRVERAAALLASTNIPVREIAPRVGYADSNYFSKVFKRQQGLTPTEYRQHVREGQNPCVKQTKSDDRF